MMTESRDNLAIQMHAAVETLIMAPSIDAYNRVSKMLATLTSAGVKSESLDEAAEAVNAVCDRYERVKLVGVSATEAEVLRMRAGELDRLLASIPVNVFKAAKSVVNANFEAMQGAA